ncbi:MAG TPA: hypothetical protein VLT32_19060 [Candidatus Sulfomarinibacteraceae bacterium]|nr:hypothetical protein [Candidatus Sulfomarinibacteraceae bacterium]
MTVRVWVMASAILMTVAPVWCQSDRLGDVAGSIKLDRSAVTEGGGTVVDPVQVRKADRELLLDVLDAARAEARRLGDLLTEARSTILYHGDDVPARLGSASRDLQAALQEIYGLRLTPPFQPALDEAREAAGTCDRAALAVRDEIERLGVAFNEATEALATCRRQIEEAALLAAGDGLEPAARGSGGDEPIEAPSSGEDSGGEDARINALCAPERGAGPDAWQSCLDRQYWALAALEARTAANEMLDQDLFDGIRKSCGNRYPDDYAARDRCEQDWMTSVRLEAESP